ncbi:conserved hypothetical protein (plasmid) [Rhodococcus jostii RHA1]|uniref:Uncharacterized protein n=2 Tax=Rhodococcus jostii TaxID=132919 RepID=Q0RUU0_RHOJR|nr:conserved hypothetical protein [Rhodococcus jostii RHA1]
MRNRLHRAATRLTEARRDLETHPDAVHLQHRLSKAESNHAEIQALYDATPGGQQDLRSAIKSEAGPARSDLERRLAAGDRLRANQIEALSRARNIGEDVRTEGADSNESRADDAGAQGGVLAEVPVDARTAAGAAQGDRAGLDGREDRGSRSPRLLIGGRRVDPLAAHRRPESERADFAARGLSSPTLYELPSSDADLYRTQMLELTRNNRYASSVYVYDEGEYAEMRILVTDDGKAGVALKDDEVVSVFSHAYGAHPNAAPSMLRQATVLGGRRLDCFDTVLPNIYADAGFVPVARLAWNDDYAPDGWDYDTYRRYNNGRPDVVFMAHDRAAVGSLYDRAAGEYVSDYDDGIAAAKAYRTTQTGP